MNTQKTQSPEEVLTQVLLDIRGITAKSVGAPYRSRRIDLFSSYDAEGASKAAFFLADAAHNLPTKIAQGEDASFDLSQIAAVYEKLKEERIAYHSQIVRAYPEIKSKRKTFFSKIAAIFVRKESRT